MGARRCAPCFAVKRTPHGVVIDESRLGRRGEKPEDKCIVKTLLKDGSMARCFLRRGARV